MLNLEASDFSPTLAPLSSEAQQGAKKRQGELTKPPGSLGQLEELPAQLAALQGTPTPVARPAAVLLFAADHPVAAEGVSAFPAEVTAAMVTNFLVGGAAASVFCKQQNLPLSVVDVGVDTPYEVPPSANEGVLTVAKDEALTAGNLRSEDAMSEALFRHSVQAGYDAVRSHAKGCKVVMLGEMGIGNTTPAAALSGQLLGLAAQDIVGAGTGVVGDALRNKQRVVQDALDRFKGRPDSESLRALGGRELAAVAGAMFAAAEQGALVLVDGFIVTSVALYCVRRCPELRPYLAFAHQSHEQGHRRLLAALDARPLVDLGLRLGEASGALAAYPLLELACALHSQMATFAAADVPRES